MQKRYLERQSSKTHQGVNERQESRRGCSPISVVRHPYFSIVGIEMDAWRAVVEKRGGAERACALTAIGTRKDLRCWCQSQSICARGREGERARMEQMEPDKKGRVLPKRGRETGDRAVNVNRRSAWDSRYATGKTVSTV